MSPHTMSYHANALPPPQPPPHSPPATTPDPASATPSAYMNVVPPVDANITNGLSVDAVSLATPNMGSSGSTASMMEAVGLPLPELINAINPRLMDYFKNGAPNVLSELLKRDQTMFGSGARSVNNVHSQHLVNNIPTSSPANNVPSPMQNSGPAYAGNFAASGSPSSEVVPVAQPQATQHANFVNVPPAGPGTPTNHVAGTAQRPVANVLSPRSSSSCQNDASISSSDVSMVAAATADTAAPATTAENANRRGSSRTGVRHSSPTRMRSKASRREKRSKTRPREPPTPSSNGSNTNRAPKQEAQTLRAPSPATYSPANGSPVPSVPLMGSNGIQIAQHMPSIPNGVVPEPYGGAYTGGAAVVPMQDVMSTQLSKMESGSDAGDDRSIDGEGDPEVKKMMRAERNRQSAAASRERKKHHIQELERRVRILSEENAQLQVGQLRKISEALLKETRLLEENKELKRKVVFQDMRIVKLSLELDKHRIDDEPEEQLKRPSTWDSASWQKRGPMAKVGR